METDYAGFMADLKEKVLMLSKTDPAKMPIVGCDPDEFEKIKIAQKVDFIPQVYYQFLLNFGHCAGVLFCGSDYNYNYLLVLKEWLIEEFSRTDPPLILPEDAFVFFGHQGYIYFYFLTRDLDNDPLVYGWTDSEHSIRNLNIRLSKFYTDEVALCIKTQQKP